MALVLRVFNSILLLIFLLSCVTKLDKNNYTNNRIIIPTNNELNVNSSKKRTEIPHNNFLRYITDGSISSISIIDSDLWIGKLGGEILRYNLYTGDTTQFSQNSYSKIDYSIKKIIDSNNQIIVLQSNRVTTINKKSSKIEIYNFPIDTNRATDIVSYKGSYYISTLGYGIREFNPNIGSFKKIISNLDYVSSLSIDGNILNIGSMNYGLYQYDLSKKILQSRIKYPLEIFNKNIVNIKLHDNILWLGTAKHGLIKWDLYSNTIEQLFEGEGVSSIFISEEGIKVVSFIGKGIYIENRGDSKFYSIKNGLISNNITSVSIFNNNLISGNIKKGIIEQEITIFDN